jgi:signal transduction histidine kinase
VPVAVDVPLGERLPESVEAAAYFVVCEALTNVAKYAHASEARVRVEHSNGHATVEVVDDGVGGADERGGSGLRGLADRVEALGGRLLVTSPAGEGTAVRAQLPVG